MDKTTSSVYRLLMGLIQLTSPPPPPPPSLTLTLGGVSFKFPAVTYAAEPQVLATSTNATSLTWILFRYIDGLNDEITDGGSVFEVSGSDVISSFQPTMFNAQYYYEVQAFGSGPEFVTVTSVLSPINNGGF